MLRLVTNLPIVYSVRSKDQGGFFPSDQADAYRELVELGIRSGCEYVDLEMAWPTTVLDTIVKSKQQSHILASWHDWSGKMAWDGQAVEAKYLQCSKYGDVVKLVGFANSPSDNAKLSIFVESHTSRPLLAINMGALGQLSRVNNTVLTPITHSALPSRAAPGQLTAKEILQARHLIGTLPTKKFYITGSPISHSMSPTLHNAGFKALGYPHVYERLEYAEVEQGLLDTYNAPDFGGASVTMPLKLKIIPHLHTVSENAKMLGAVNTVVPYLNAKGEREFFGDNTDWQAIHEAAKTNLDPSATSSGKLDVLVIGAGGTCRAALFAMHELGATTIYLYNRTIANAESVKSSFPDNFNIKVIDSLDLTFVPSVVVSTVPGESLSLDKSTGIYLNGDIVLKGERGVAIDLAYKPRKTALMELAKRKSGWKAIAGLEILCLQGFRQFQMWTGKVAPKDQIREAVYGQYNREHPE
jgi:pentafunctional AROM polypeptide